MAIEPIGAIAQSPLAARTAATPAGGADFAAQLGQGVARLDADLAKADGMLRAFAAGETVAVHDLMIAMEHARVSLQFAVETRNKLVDAYQELMRMPL